MPSVVGQEGEDADGDGLVDPPPPPLPIRGSIVQNLLTSGRFVSITGGNTIDLTPVVQATAIDISGSPLEAFDLFGDRVPV